MQNYFLYDTPIGPIGLCENGEAVTGFFFGSSCPKDSACRETSLLHEAFRQLSEYFDGSRRSFELPLAPAGTPFQQSVWAALCSIPYGETRSYGQIAAQLGRPGASRAVGMANHNNPIAIFIPCHRVVGADGRLTGYAGGLELKERLLRLEHETMQNAR